MSPGALRAMSTCIAHADCSADCATEAAKTATSADADAFVAACKKAAAACPALGGAEACDVLADGIHAKLLGADLIHPLTACFAKADCTEQQTCLASANPTAAMSACEKLSGNPFGGPSAATGDGDVSETQPPSTLVGKPLPAFSGTVLGSKKPLKSSSLVGKVAIIHFWASWAGPCKLSLPALQKIADKNKKNLVVVGVSEDDEPDGPAKFATAMKLKFASIYDDGKAASKACSTGTMPYTLIVDRKGIVRFEHPGFNANDPALYEKEAKSLF